PESTIMESTTTSLASGSIPRCETTISPLERFSSIALMLLEPMSNPTIVFPEPNIAVRLIVCSRVTLSPCPGRLGPFGLFLGAAHVHRALLFHPLVQNGFFEFPAVPEFEGRDLFFGHVLVQRVRTDSQILRSLSNVHHFTRLCCHRR